jgi:hypothetical protein
MRGKENGYGRGGYGDGERRTHVASLATQLLHINLGYSPSRFKLLIFLLSMGLTASFNFFLTTTATLLCLHWFFSGGLNKRNNNANRC